MDVPGRQFLQVFQSVKLRLKHVLSLGFLQNWTDNPGVQQLNQRLCVFFSGLSLVLLCLANAAVIVKGFISFC